MKPILDNTTKPGTSERVFFNYSQLVFLAIVIYGFFTAIALPDEHAKDESGQLATSTIYVGVRDDAMPFSFKADTRPSETVLAGYSGYMVEVCRYVLKEMQGMSEYENLEFRALQTTALERYKSLSDGRFLFLCGPDSITLELMDDFRTSLPIFLSGMTYAYINPRSQIFPHGNHCKSIIGVVRGTTADKNGLRELSVQNLLMRFDRALDLELTLTPDKIHLANEKLIEIVKATLKSINLSAAIAKDQLDKLREQSISFESYISGNAAELLEGLKTHSTRSDLLEQVLNNSDPNRTQTLIDQLTDTDLKNYINGRMGEEYKGINEEIASMINTVECPDGFLSMPVRKYRDHDKGIKRFCEGEVLYYLGDYDILKNKTQSYSNCDVVMNRFTRTKEVYGVFFSNEDDYNPDTAIALKEGTINVETIKSKKHSVRQDRTTGLIDIPRFYSDFNKILFFSMQGKESKIEKIFADSFDGEEKSDKLKDFFEGFKISSFSE